MHSSDIPCDAKSENAVVVLGLRFLAFGMLPEGLRSRGRRGCGEVTTGFAGTEGFDFVFVSGLP